jgi:hypothetical protein
MSKLILNITIIFILSANFLYCQKTYNATNQIWIGNELKFEPINNLDFEINNVIRLDLSNTIIDNSFLELGTSYGFLEYFKLSLYMRLKNNEPEWISEYYSNFQVSLPISDFTIKYRTRYQNKDNIYRLKEVIRQRLMLEYRLTDNSEIAAGSELFYDFSQDRNDRVRYRAEYKQKIAKRHTIEIGYIYDNQLNRKSPESRDVLYLTLGIKVL